MSLQNAAHVYKGKVVGAGGGSGECELFPIQLTGAGTVGSPYAVDVTPAELGDALDAGKYPVIMQYDNREYVAYPFTWMEDDRMIFEFERLEDHQVSADYHTVRAIKVWLEVNGTDWDTISIETRDFDLTTKADKVSGATNGNLASLDANGNLADSGKKASDFALASSLGTAAAKDVPTSGDASSAQVVMGNDSRLSDARTPTAHNHSAADINTASTFGAKVMANSTAAATLSDGQVRNIYAGTSDMTAGTTTLTTGQIYVVYE
ncbi:MAG: hypothetical protein J6Y02_02120 [Pseudobutyrivibrio sp.]|nr:hypothetical protein [Pseudobutyrivibrio sp.]